MIRFTLRLPDELHKLLVQDAERHERSLNAHIIYIFKVWRAHQAPSEERLPEMTQAPEGEE